MYDPLLAGVEDRTHTIARMRRTLPMIRAGMIQADPGAAPGLRPYPST